MPLICPSCATALPERGFFCLACAVQVRCKACHEPLEPHARACVMCGAGVGTDGVTHPLDGKTSDPINTFELQEDLRSRTVRLHLTDHAVAHVGDALSAVFADRITGKPRTAQHVRQQAESVRTMLPAPAEQQGSDAEELAPQMPATTNPAPENDQQRLRQIFEYEGDEVRLEEDRLKADSGQDYARRLTYLFLYAHELEGRKPVPYAGVKKILETAKIWDNNTRHALTHKMAVEIENEMVRLKSGGRKAAMAALTEILDPSHPDPGWAPETRTRIPKATAETKDVKAKATKPGRKRSTQAEQWATAWEKHTDHVNGHFILKDKKIPDKALFALWAIHKVGGKSASPLFVQRFISNAFSYNEKVRTVAVALARKQADDLVLKTEGGYKLTPSGTKHVEQLIKAAKP